MIIARSLQEAGDTLSTLQYWAIKGTDVSTFLDANFKLMSHTEKALNALSSVRRISENNAKELLKQHKSLRKVILKKDYNVFLSVDKLGPKGIESLG